jgi:hypothetical protein
MSVKQMALVWELDLAPNKRLVLLAYADHADDDGDNVFPSLGRVAHKTGYSVDQVRRLSRDLVDDGLMELAEKGVGRGNTHRYRLTLEKGVKLPPFKPKREKVADDKEKVASRPQKVAPMPPEPSVEPSTNHSRRDGKPSPEQTNWMTVYCEQAKRFGVSVSDEDRNRLPGNLVRCQAKEGASDSEMYRLIGQILTRRIHNVILSPQEALNDIRGIPSGRSQRRSSAPSIAVVGAKESDYDESEYELHA